MKNTIKMNRENEIKAKEAAKAAKEKEEALKDIKPLNIVETLKQLEDEKTDAKVVCDKDGNPIAVCGGKYLCEMYKGEVIGATTQEKLDAIKARIDKGIHGDGLLHKMVTINGKVLPCVGASVAEIEKDVRSLEIYSKEHPEEPRRDLTVATMLKEAGFKSEDLEQVTVSGSDYLLVYADPDGGKNYVMNLDGSTVKCKDGKEVSLSDIEDELSRKTVKILLLERLNKAVISKQADPKPASKLAAPKAPKSAAARKPRSIESQAVEITVEVRPCSIILSRHLSSMSLEDVIKEVLRGQRWGHRSMNGNPNCPWLIEASNSLSSNRDMDREVVLPTTAFILEKIVSESPIEATSLKDLETKVANIILLALRDEPYFGMAFCDGQKLAKIMAAHIISHSDIIYR